MQFAISSRTSSLKEAIKSYCSVVVLIYMYVIAVVFHRKHMYDDSSQRISVFR